jgi:hypothetical protein
MYRPPRPEHVAAADLTMPDDRTDCSTEEYAALRATIRERGTTRLTLVVVVFIAWAALAIVVQAWLQMPLAVLLPLLVLFVGFEVVFALHVGVERVGRYLEVYYERPGTGPPAWEHAVTRLAGHRDRRASGIDPLFVGPFLAAAVVNLAPVAILRLAQPEPTFTWAGLPVELAVYGLIHALFAVRVLRARSFAAAQRRVDLETFAKDR